MLILVSLFYRSFLKCHNGVDAQGKGMSSLYTDAVFSIDKTGGKINQS